MSHPPPPGSRPALRSLPVLGGGDAPLHAGAALARARPAAASSLYIHVPFCFHKCHYCDFYSIVDTRDRQEPFVRRLLEELEALAPWARTPLETLFVGGGTPSLLSPALWRTLLRRLDELFGSGSMASRGGEFTVECNPETVTDELADTLATGGVTRVSMGAQSFNAAHLQTLERRHDPANVERALERVHGAGISRRSIDLIFGIPGQTMAHWLGDLDMACSLGTEHLSCYGLTYEQGTAMTARLERGDFAPMDDDLEADMFEATVDALERRGLPRYELSNFARPGAECRHNLVYWRQGNWLAAGPSASGHIDGLRWKNRPRLDDYLRETPDGTALIAEAEAPDGVRNLVEAMMTGLRLVEGVDAAAMLGRAGAIDAPRRDRLERWSRDMSRQGMLDDCDGRWRLTSTGMRLANRAILEAAEAIDPS
ncbi:MAG: radical SAM family heme chaperone HemW [Phycisphaerae bacterium]